MEPPELLIEMSGTIEQLTKLCVDLIQELAQYRSIEAEEKKLLDII